MMSIKNIFSKFISSVNTVDNTQQHSVDINTEVAMNLLYGEPISLFAQMKADKIKRECNSNQDILNAVIELVKDADTPQKRYYSAVASINSTAKYRKRTIALLNQYIGNQLYDKAFKMHNIDDTYEQRKNNHLCDMYMYLGKAYEGEYLFDYAYQSYMMCDQLCPDSPLGIVDCSRILVKMNKLNDALNLLISKRSNIYYNSRKQDAWYLKSIEDNINDIELKIEKGYTYRQRKRQDT